MHFCFVTYGSWEGNAGLIRHRQLGAELLERGHRVTYVVDNVPYNHASLELHPRAEVAFVAHPKSLLQIPARRKLIKQLRPDYVHLLNGHAKSYLALVGRKQKIIGDWDEPRTLKDLGFARNMLERFVDRWQRNRDGVKVTCTLYLQQLFRDRYALETAHIPHAPYLPTYSTGDSPFTAPTAVYMGNFYPAWDHDVVLEAALVLKKRGLMPRIVLMGAGPDLEKWRKFVAENGLSNVELPGFISGEQLWLRDRPAAP